MIGKRGGRSQARRGGGMKTGLVLVIGLLIGLGLAAAYLVFGDRQKLDALLPKPDPQAQAPAPAAESEALAPEPEAAAETSRPTFDFYTVLPQREVALPNEAAPAADRPPAPTTPAATVAYGLQLQAGAFSNAADAEALRATLALVGQIARIETVETDGRTLHRVRLGPFADEGERAAVQKALAEAGITATPAR